MRFAATAAGLMALASSAMAQTLTINTPTTTLQECHPIALQWSGGTAPYYLYVYNEDGMTEIEQLNDEAITATSGTWTINVAAGTEIYFLVQDNTGTSATSSPVTISEGSSTDCTTTTYFSYSGYSTTADSATSSSPAATTTAAAAATSSAASSRASSRASAASSAASASASAASASAAASLSSVVSSASSALSAASSSVSVAVSSASSAASSASSSLSTATGTASAAASSTSSASAGAVVQGSFWAVVGGALLALFA